MATVIRGRQAYGDDLRRHSAYWYFSATTFTLRRALLPLLEKYVRGRTLDAGAGGLHAKPLLEAHCTDYVSTDLLDRHGDLDVIADIQDLRGLANDSFDSVFCSQVLEHLPAPALALAELNRVLRPGGHALIAVPHLSALHEVPHDYFRFTPYGLERLMQGAGFDLIESRRAGGLLTFLSHPFSYVINAVGWRLPVLRWVFWAVNVVAIVLPVAALDAILGTARIWPTNVIAVGRKPSA